VPETGVLSSFPIQQVLQTLTNSIFRVLYSSRREIELEVKEKYDYSNSGVSVSLKTRAGIWMAWISLICILPLLIPALIYSLNGIFEPQPIPGTQVDGGPGLLIFPLTQILIYFLMIFVLTFGFTTRPRYYWVGLLIAGIFDLTSFSRLIKESNLGPTPAFQTVLFFSLSGVILIGSGIVLGLLANTRRKKM
jgi:hypothetical protein